MAPRDDRVQSEKEESGRFQSAGSHQQERGQARTKEYPGQNGHQSPRLDLSRVHSSKASITSIKPFRSSLVARKSAQNYQSTGRPRGRPTNKSRLRDNSLPSSRVHSAGRHQAVTRSNGAEIDRYTNQKNEEETSNAHFRKDDRMKNSGDVQVSQSRIGRLDPKENLGSYKRSSLSVTTAGSDTTREYRPANDEPPKSRIKRTSEISLECRPQDRSTDMIRNRTLSAASQFSPPPELKSSRSSASALHRNFNRPGMVTVPGRSGIDIVTSIPTSAMPISSGSTPPHSFQLGQKRTRNLEFTFCHRCGKASTPGNVLIRCSECDNPYHSLCHRPDAIPNNKIWKCPRCKGSEQQSNASTPMGQSSNSTSSETSASSVTSAAALIPLSTGPSFKSDGSERNRTDRPRNKDAHLENFHSYSDDDRLRKRFKGDTSTQKQWSSEDTALGRVYGDLEYGELARSKIFHGSQTFAVVIGSRSRSTSASADGKQNNHQGRHQDFEHAVTAKISQGTSERLTKRTSITGRSSPPPAALTSYNEDLSVLKQACLPPEIKDSQEMDYELVDAQMSLDSADLHSPVQERTMHSYKVYDNMAYETLGRTTPYWDSHEHSRYERPLSYDKSRPFPEDSSPQYSPSVGDRERNETKCSINQEYRETSSPPYSPPPPDVDVSYEGPVKDLTHLPLPQTTQQEQLENSDNWFSCAMCDFHTKNNGQYKNNICGSCALHPVPLRNSRVIQEPPQPTAQRTAGQTRHQAGQKPYRKRVRNKHPKHFKPTLSTSFPNHEAPKNSTPEESCAAPAARKFQTSKDRVNEKYSMNEPVPSKPRAISVLRKNKDEEPIKNTLEPRASCDIPDKGGKPEAVATNGESRRPVRPSNSTGPARKFPSTPISHGESPPPGMVSTTERSVSRNDNNPPKKKPQRPAVKNAEGSIQYADSDDSDEPVSDRAKIKMLEKRLAEQRSCTKNQRNAARRLQEKLTEATRVREELSAKLAQARKIKKSDPIKLGKLAAVPLKLKDLYKDIDFTASSPWPCPPEIPEPDPRTFRKPGWRKQQKKAPEYDTKRMMKVHLHRQLTCAKTQPPKIIPGSLHDLSNAHMDSRSNSLDDEYSEYSLGGLETTIDEFLGFPENMVPAVKDGVLGFRPGIINQRTRRLDRNVQHCKVRTPGALLDRI